MAVGTKDAAELLGLAHGLIANQADRDDPLNQAAQHLIACAADAVRTLECGDIESAQEALGCARAAVDIASYVVVKLADEVRKRGIVEGLGTGRDPDLDVWILEGQEQSLTWGRRPRSVTPGPPVRLAG